MSLAESLKSDCAPWVVAEVARLEKELNSTLLAAKAEGVLSNALQDRLLASQAREQKLRDLASAASFEDFSEAAAAILAVPMDSSLLEAYVSARLSVSEAARARWEIAAAKNAACIRYQALEIAAITKERDD